MGVGSGLSSLSALSCPPSPLYAQHLEPPFCNGVWHLLVHWHKGSCSQVIATRVHVKKKPLTKNSGSPGQTCH